MQKKKRHRILPRLRAVPFFLIVHRERSKKNRPAEVRPVFFALLLTAYKKKKGLLIV